MIDPIRKAFEFLLLGVIIWLMLLTTGVIFNTFRINSLIDKKTVDRYTSHDAARDIGIMKDLIQQKCSNPQ